MYLSPPISHFYSLSRPITILSVLANSISTEQLLYKGNRRHLTYIVLKCIQFHYMVIHFLLLGLTRGSEKYWKRFGGFSKVDVGALLCHVIMLSLVVMTAEVMTTMHSSLLYSKF